MAAQNANMYLIARVSSGEHELVLHLGNIPGGNIETLIGAGANAVTSIARGITEAPGNEQVNAAVQAGSPAPAAAEDLEEREEEGVAEERDEEGREGEDNEEEEEEGGGEEEQMGDASESEGSMLSTVSYYEDISPPASPDPEASPVASPTPSVYACDTDGEPVQ